MPAKLAFRCLPTAIGSMPHTDPEKAVRDVLAYLPSLPVWPQLPQRSFLENMYAQYSAGFPNLVLDREAGRIHVDRLADMAPGLEKLYADSLGGSAEDYRVTHEYASGLHAFLDAKVGYPLAAKGQVTGPISWGLAVTDQDGRSILYDDTLADAAARHLGLKARWQEQALRAVAPTTILFLDEPYLSSVGSAFTPVSREVIVRLIGVAMSGVVGVRGVHCCGNTDWSVLLETEIDILSYDAYNYSLSLSLYPEGVKRLLDRGGSIAWGIVPNDELLLAKETVSSLKDRLEDAMAPFTRKGLRFSQLLEQSLLTPSCGLAMLTPDGARQALEFLAGLSEKMRRAMAA